MFARPAVATWPRAISSARIALFSFAPFFVRRADDQHALARLMGGRVLARDLFPALFGVGDFADVAAAFKDRSDSAISPLAASVDGFAEFQVALAADGVQPGNGHSRLLHLIDGPSRFDRMMLALVADEDDPLDAFLACLVEEPVDLPGREQARFVNNPDLFRLRRAAIGFRGGWRRFSRRRLLRKAT